MAETSNVKGCATSTRHAVCRSKDERWDSKGYLEGMLDRQGGLQRICYVAERILCGVDSERSTKTQEVVIRGLWEGQEIRFLFSACGKRQIT